MTNFLYPLASHWAGKDVPCRFQAFANDIPLAGHDSTEPAYVIPNGTTEVRLVVTPISKDYWETEILLSVSGTGELSVTSQTSPFVRLRAVVSNNSRATVVIVKVSRFKEFTDDTVALLKQPPTRRHVLTDAGWVMKHVNEPSSHLNDYGVWPPDDWKIHPLPEAHFLKASDPLTGNTLNFEKAPTLDIAMESVVLRIAGGAVPELFAVLWPNSDTMTPHANADPTPFLVYCRQTNKGNHYDQLGLFVGGDLDKLPYPNNFDYADSGLFESLHYGSVAPGSGAGEPSMGPFFWAGAKGVPYQVAKSEAQIATVIPCNKFGAEFGVLKNTEQMARILEEIQAFMFWRAGIEEPPTTIGATALAAFSSGNYLLTDWIKNDDNLKGDFLKKTLRAVYFLDPPEIAVEGCVAAALKWADKATDPRIRLYSQYRKDVHKQLLGMKPTDKLPPAPYFLKSDDEKRTATALPVDACWWPTYEAVFGVPRTPLYAWGDIHHIMPGTMLTHALSQKDI